MTDWLPTASMFWRDPFVDRPVANSLAVSPIARPMRFISRSTIGTSLRIVPIASVSPGNIEPCAAERSFLTSPCQVLR